MSDLSHQILPLINPYHQDAQGSSTAYKTDTLIHRDVQQESTMKRPPLSGHFRESFRLFFGNSLVLQYYRVCLV